MKKKKSNFNFPPDVFWIDSSNGEILEITGHLTDIQVRPERYGFSFAPHTPTEIDRAWNDLLSHNWVRGRMDGSVGHFQVWEVNNVNVGLIYAFVYKYKDFITDITVDETIKNRNKDFTIEDFDNQKYSSSWLMNPRKKRSK